MGPSGTYLHERVAIWPELTAARLLREIREQGCRGSDTVLKDLLRRIRPPRAPVFELRLETPAGQQAQVDFAKFRAEFAGEPGQERKERLFAMVPGHSHCLWPQIVLHQDLPTLLRCHMGAFEHFGGATQDIQYDRMKTAVPGKPEAGCGVIYNAKLLSLGARHGFVPQACQPHGPKTKNKVERSYRHLRADYFLARHFAGIGDMRDINGQLRPAPA